MSDHINRLSIVLKNMQQKRLLTWNEVESISDGAVRGNAKIIDILQDFFNENQQQQEVEVLEKKILTFLKEQDVTSSQLIEEQKTKDIPSKEATPSSQSKEQEQNQTQAKSDEIKATEEKKSSNPNQSNTNNDNKKQPNHISFGHFFSNKSHISDSQKYIATLSQSKQQALQYLKSILDFKQKFYIEQVQFRKIIDRIIKMKTVY